MLCILVRNILSNWAGFAINVAITLLLTPFVLHHLGDSRYGIWALATGLTGYFGLLDMGFRAAVTQYLTRHLAMRDFDKLNATASTAFVALAACAVLVTITTLVISWCAPFAFTIPAESVDESRWTILIIGCSVACQFVFFPFAAVFAATQRYDIGSAIAVCVRLLYAAAAVVCLQSGYGLIALSAVAGASELLGSVLRWRLAYRILPQLRVSLPAAHFHSLWEITSYSIWTVLVTGGSRLIDATDLIVIGLFLPVAAITPFALASGVVAQLGNLFLPIGSVFFPAMTQMDAQGDTAGVREVYLAGSRMMYSLAISAGLIAAACADDFYRVWLDSDSLDSSVLASTSVIFLTLLLGLIVTTGQRIGYQVMLGTRRMRTIAALFAAEGFANLLLSTVLIHSIGLLGVAIGTLVPAIIMQGIVHPAVVSRQLEISCHRYFREVLLRPTGFALALGAGLLVMRGVMTPATNWTELFLFGALAGLTALMALVTIGLRRDERKRFVIEPLKRIALRLLKHILPQHNQPTAVVGEATESPPVP